MSCGWNRSSLQARSKLFNQETRLFFHTKLPQISDPVHIVYSRSAFQYINNWIELMHSFARYKPRFLVLDCVWAGDIESFVTIQNFNGRKIRFHFINLEELV